MTRQQIVPGKLLAQARTLQRSKTARFPSTGLAAVIADVLGTATTFDNPTLPFAAVTTDIAHVIDSDDLMPALLATATSRHLPAVDPDGRRRE
jgi:NTE family protein